MPGAAVRIVIDIGEREVGSPSLRRSRDLVEGRPDKRMPEADAGIRDRDQTRFEGRFQNVDRHFAAGLDPGRLHHLGQSGIGVERREEESGLGVLGKRRDVSREGSLHAGGQRRCSCGRAMLSGVQRQGARQLDEGKWIAERLGEDSLAQVGLQIGSHGIEQPCRRGIVERSEFYLG